MKKKKNRFILIPLLMIVFGVSVYFVSDFLADNKLRFADVYIAARDLDAREEIKEEDLTKISIPEAYLNEDTYTDLKDIVGKYVRNNSYIAKGSLFYKDYLEDAKEMNDGYFTRLKKGEASFNLTVRDITVNTATLKLNQYLDLYLTINRKEVISDLLISGARVVGLYDNQNNEVDDNTQGDIAMLTIALKKEMIPYLNKALAIGEISVSTSSDLYEERETDINLSEELLTYLS